MIHLRPSHIYTMFMFIIYMCMLTTSIFVFYLSQHVYLFRAVLICNPSNPCGSVYTSSHLRAAVAVVAAHNHSVLAGTTAGHVLPVIGDEIYALCVYNEDSGEDGGAAGFAPLADICVAAGVPLVSVGGIAKQFVVPGWRVGWVVIVDANGMLNEVRAGIRSLTQLNLGTQTFIQTYKLAYIYIYIF